MASSCGFGVGDELGLFEDELDRPFLLVGRVVVSSEEALHLGSSCRAGVRRRHRRQPRERPLPELTVRSTLSVTVRVRPVR